MKKQQKKSSLSSILLIERSDEKLKKMKKIQKRRGAEDFLPVGVSRILYPDLVTAVNKLKLSSDIQRVSEAFALQAQHKKIRFRDLPELAEHLAKELSIYSRWFFYTATEPLIDKLVSSLVSDFSDPISLPPEGILKGVLSAMVVEYHRSQLPKEKRRIIEKLLAENLPKYAEAFSKKTGVPKVFIKGQLAKISSVLCGGVPYGAKEILRKEKEVVGSAGRLIRDLLAFITSPNDPRPYDPPAKSGKISKKLDEMEVMKIIHLPMPSPTDTSMTVRSRANYGSRLITRRLPYAVAAQSTARLFRRFRHVQRGTVLIDASGSMGFTKGKLEALCRKIPASTVAYYYGTGYMWGYEGVLTVYAKGGKRASEIPEITGSGNDVDYWAIKWLLEQKDDFKVLVSDGGFCGGLHGQAEAAMTLLQQSIRERRVIWFSTVEKALEYFRIASPS